MTVGELVNTLSEYLSGDGASLDDEVYVGTPLYCNSSFFGGFVNIPPTEFSRESNQDGNDVMALLAELNNFGESDDGSIYDKLSPEMTKVFGERLVELQMTLGYTQGMMVDILGIDRCTIVRYKKGSIVPKITTVKMLAGRLGLTMEQLLAGDFDSCIKRLAIPELTPGGQERPFSYYYGDGTDFDGNAACDRILEFREKLNYSQMELADKLGISATSVHGYEKHKVAVTPITMDRLLRYFDLSLKQFMEGDFDEVVKKYGFDEPPAVRGAKRCRVFANTKTKKEAERNGQG